MGIENFDEDNLRGLNEMGTEENDSGTLRLDIDASPEDVFGDEQE